jgi:hypothetical protein
MGLPLRKITVTFAYDKATQVQEASGPARDRYETQIMISF